MSIQEIRVASQGDDPEADALRKRASQMLGIDIDVITTRIFRTEGVDEDEAQQLATELFVDPVTQTSRVGKRNDWNDPRRIEVDYKPGVRNPEEDSITRGASLLGVNPAAVGSANEYRFAQSTPLEDVRRVVHSLLVNDTIQQVRAAPPESLKITGNSAPIETVEIRDLDDTQLEELSKTRKLSMDIAGLKSAQTHFKKESREPRDAELEAIAGRWSEHCGHPTFNADMIVDGQHKASLFSRLKAASMRQPRFETEIPSAFDDNSGVFLFYDGMAICIKVETHNSPSAIEPYGGSMTGVGGVLRDIMGTGLGAKNILSIDIFCFAPEDLPADDLPVNCLPPDYLQSRVIDGVRDYGNRMGIPTGNGSTHYHPNFKAKPTVMVGALGLIPEKYAKKGEPQSGDLVVTVGGRTGRDGIHGATMSSASMTAETSTVHSSAVQIGDPITEKKMDALLEARDAGCLRALTDCGAAGFSSAIGEMGEEIGVQVDIANAPLKYEGLAPWEIWMSESQERMVAAVIPEQYETFQEICEKHEVEVAALGTFGTPEGEPKLHVTYGDEVLIDLDYDFLKHGLPKREMVANWQAPTVAEAPSSPPTDWIYDIEKVLSHGNVCSKEPTVRQYDHEVQGNTVVKPFSGVHKDAPNDGVVLTPLPGKPYGVVEAHGMNPVLNDTDPYQGTLWAFAEAAANYTAMGGNPDDMNFANNFVTATPDEHVMGVLDKMVDGIEDCMDATGATLISGKDSLSSRYVGKMPNGENVTIDVPPVLTITIAGKIPDVAKTVTSDIKQPGSTLVLVGRPDYEGMGSSVWYDTNGGTSARLPHIELGQLPKNLRSVHAAIQDDHILACHDVSEGGLITTLAEMAFGGDCGIDMKLASDIAAERQLFNETAGCLVVEVADEGTAEALFANVPHQIVGHTKPEKTIAAKQGDLEIFTASVDRLKAAWKRQPLQEAA